MYTPPPHGKLNFIRFHPKAMKAYLLRLAVCGILLLAQACSSIPQPRSSAYLSPGGIDADFMVFSDPHLYSRSLGAEGKAWEEYLLKDRKLLAESEDLLLQALEEVRREKPQFLLIPGDLTKDGELVNHRLLASHLRALAEDGIPSFVVPGNHDVANPHAKAFGPEGEFSVPSVSPGEFAEIYREAGYGAAFSRDPASLSYAAEPVPGLVLLALDACRYEEQKPGGAPITDGRLKSATVAWLRTVLSQGQRAGKNFIVMIHHGLVEHFRGAESLLGAYIVDGFRELTPWLAQEGVRLAFTGHGHAQDITSAWGLTDVETGSLVTWPNPLRRVELRGRRARITSRFLTGFPAWKGPGAFGDYAREYARAGMESFALQVGKRRLGLSDSDGRKIASQGALALLAHYRGDEAGAPDPRDLWNTEGLGFWAFLVAEYLRPVAHGLSEDLPPEDNDVVVHW